jgi:2-dehydropantoate 2-reductase
MRTAILGAGAMGSIFGALLAKAGKEVVLVDSWLDGVQAIQAHGLRLHDREGNSQIIPVKATTDPSGLGEFDVVIVFVKSYQTLKAVEQALPLLSKNTVVLTLQNGWGNAARIAEVCGGERVLAGVTYNSGTLLEPGVVQHAGAGVTFLGELNGKLSQRAERIAQLLNNAGIEAKAVSDVVREIWAKLSLNVCTLPTSALLRCFAGELVEHASSLNLMRALLEEAVAVAQALGVHLDREERWQTITGLLRRAAGAKASMLQDIENRRQTEIDVVNGAVVDAGGQKGIPTPYNQSMVWLVSFLQESFNS